MPIGRRPFALAAAALLVQMRALAQSPGRMYRVGYLQTATPQEQEALTRAFDDALRGFGYVEGRNLVLERRFAHGQQDRLAGLAAELVGLEPDVIVTGGNIVIAAVQRATSTIPVVMGTSRDPVGSGFVASLAHPGGNITGNSADPTVELQGKRLELLKTAVPDAARVAWLWNPQAPGAAGYRSALDAAALSLRVTIQAYAARTREDFPAAFARMAGDGQQALVVQPDPLFFTARQQVVELAVRHRLPAVYHAREFVELGGLMSYGASLEAQFRRAAAFVHKILQGARPAEMPVEQASVFELAIHVGSAAELKLRLPRNLLLQADHLVG
jgi:putative tryptophan/tyrosine transport system substrate-binding protein